MDFFKKADTAAQEAADRAEQAAGAFKAPTKEQISAIVARLRHRGSTNPLFNDVAQAFERANPEWKTVWEYSPPDSKDQSEVMLRASMGYRLVNQVEIPEGYHLPHTQREGPVRVADAVLMAAPVEIHDAIYAELARVAHDEANLPATEYKKQLEEKGTIPGKVKGMALGDITHASEMVELNIGAAQASMEVEE